MTLDSCTNWGRGGGVHNISSESSGPILTKLSMHDTNRTRSFRVVKIGVWALLRSLKGAKSGENVKLIKQFPLKS